MPKFDPNWGDIFRLNITPSRVHSQINRPLDEIVTLLRSVLGPNEFSHTALELDDRCTRALHRISVSFYDNLDAWHKLSRLHGYIENVAIVFLKMTNAIYFEESEMPEFFDWRAEVGEELQTMALPNGLVVIPLSDESRIKLKLRWDNG